MIYGGYPAIILEPNIPEKIERLEELRDSFIKRDIMESGVANQAAFYNFKMPKVFLLDTGLRNCLLNNFNPIDQRPDRGELLENTIFNLLSSSFGKDSIQYWRTSSGNEVDFVIPNIPDPRAIEVKFNKNLIKISKYNKFIETYPGTPLQFTWMKPFDESFFHRINRIIEGKI